MQKFRQHKRTLFVNAYDKFPRVGNDVMVHAYKYQNWLYRTWTYPTVIENNDEFLVLCSTNSFVKTNKENTPRVFPSSIHKPSFWFFFKDKWMNIIATIETYGVKLYINVASPYIYEEGAIKYYDFDLDFKTRDHYNWVELDIKEYFENQIKYNYPQKLINKINEAEIKIKQLIDKKWFNRFNQTSFLSSLYKKYLWIMKRRENKYGHPKNKTFRQ